MKAFFGRRWWVVAVILAVGIGLTACSSDKPRRDEPSPFAPQWKALKRMR